MNDDLIERVKTAIEIGAPVFPDILKDCLAALSPVLPEEVEAHIKMANGLNAFSVANLIERLARDRNIAIDRNEALIKENIKMQQRIEELAQAGAAYKELAERRDAALKRERAKKNP